MFGVSFDMIRRSAIDLMSIWPSPRWLSRLTGEGLLYGPRHATSFNSASTVVPYSFASAKRFEVLGSEVPISHFETA